MHIAYYRDYSNILNREMEFKVFGHAGKPCIVFPAQDGNFYDFENFGMVNSVEKYINAGQLQLFCIQSIDKETWSSRMPSEYQRMQLHEDWVSYVIDELLPRLYAIHNTTAQENYQGKFMTTGVSMGAYHALNFLLRFPERFDATICLSGLYRASYFFPNYHEELVYRNSPVDYMANMPSHHPYLEKYRNCWITLCCGQGNWEEEGIKDAHALETEFKKLDVPAWIDFWGFDVCHDWPWWQKQFPYYVGKLLEKK